MLPMATSSSLWTSSSLPGPTGIGQAKGQVGSAFDISVPETLFAELKKDLVYRLSWQIRNKIWTEMSSPVEN